ncbi:hypothetical protein [Planococcus salinarum]|nr:hypothetical protein [Planococcus salinarum]
MLRFLGKYSHWLLLALVSASLLVSFFSGNYDSPSLIFGIIGVGGIGYLVYRIEVDKKRKN